MDPQRWSTVADVLGEALGMPADARAAYLDAACGADAELRREVEALLALDERSGDLLDSPGANLPPLLASGERIGPYQLQRLIGAGGMGAVYLAARVDDEFRQMVAIKILQPGTASPDVVRRFRSERQILASLKHANIARLFDGGLTRDGQPYFVMEYIEGHPIDRFCEETAASIPRKVEIFRQVCDAVQAAHRALIIHRDIKPGNIIVQADGTPKLLDFGIAKILDAHGDFDSAQATVTSLRPMTPEYASPEQVRGDAVATPSDIYSLGVVLYKLLVGTVPHRASAGSLAAIERSICGVDPESPRRATAGRIDRDLSAIVMKALRKEPNERYGSVEQLSADLLRYQQGYPVDARRGSTAYQAAKFLRRNRTAAAAMSLVTISLAAGFAASTWQASIARAERRKADAQRQLAERRFAQVRQLATSLLFEFDTAIADLAGATAARQLVVSKALQYLAALARDAQGDMQLLTEVADAYQRVGTIQGAPFFANLGDRAGALRSYRESLRLWEFVASRPGSTADATVQTAFVHRLIGDVLADEGQSGDALLEYRTALETIDRTRSGLSGSYQNAVRGERIGLIGRIGTALVLVGQITDGVAWCERALAEGRALSKDGGVEERHDLSVLYSRAGKALLEAGATDAAAELHREEISVSEALVAQAPPEKNTHFKRDAAIAYRNLADVFFARRQIAAALEMEGHARRIQESILAADSADSQMRKELAATYSRIGTLLVRQGRPAEAERALAHTLRLGALLLKDDPTSAAYRITYADGLSQMASLQRHRGSRNDARRLYRTDIDVLEPVEKTLQPVHRAQLMKDYESLAAIEPDPAKAASYARKASALARTFDDGARPHSQRPTAARPSARRVP